jgi:hypothetical protein
MLTLCECSCEKNGINYHHTKALTFQKYCSSWMGLTYLEIDDDKHDHDGGNEAGEIGRILSVEGLLEGVDLVALGEEEVEQGDDCALVLSALVSSDRHERETLPQDVLTDVSSNEKLSSTA